MKKIIYIFLFALIFSSCSKTEVEEAEEVVEEVTPVIEEEVKFEPQKDKTLKVSMRLPKTLNPLINEDATVDKTLKLIFEPLVVIDESFRPVPNILESFNISENGSSVKLSLKNNLKWHDGTPITSNDIIYSVDVIKNAAENTIYKDMVKNISSCEYVDELTVNVNFSAWNISNSYSLNFPIIPKHYYIDSLDRKEPLGNGCFMFSSYDNIREINFVKNPNYFKGEPLIDNLKIIVTKDMDSEINAFQQRVISTVSSDIVDLGKFRGSIETGTTEFLTSNFDFIGFNFTNNELKEPQIRKAIAYLIDKEEILKTIYLNHAQAAQTPINPSSWAYDTKPAQFYFDIEASVKLIGDLGYVKGEDGKFARTTEFGEHRLNFRILANSNNSEGVKVSEHLQANMLKAGFSPVLEIVDEETYFNRINSRDFDILVGGFFMSNVPDLSFMLHSSRVNDTNVFSYSNELMDTKLNVVSSAFSETDLRNALSDLQLYIADELPIISLVYRKSALLTDKTIHGEFKPTQNNIYNDINEWFIYE